MPPTPRIGRWEIGADRQATLIASHCRTCGETSFPERAFCPNCRSQDLEESRLAGPATLYSYTVVHQVPAGFDGPLAVGYAKFPGDVIVLAPIDAPAGTLARGMRLAVRQGTTSTNEDGTPFVTYRFAPFDGGDGRDA
jgi:uncharacterized OB-fold protein